jgi:hypothetical protein
MKNFLERKSPQKGVAGTEGSWGVLEVMADSR